MLSQIVRSAFTAAIQALIILLVALALGVHIHTGVLGWLVILARGDPRQQRVRRHLAGDRAADAARGDDDRGRELHRPAAALPLLDAARRSSRCRTGCKRRRGYNPVDWGVNAAREVVLPGTDWGAVGWHLLSCSWLSAATAGLVGDTYLPCLPAQPLEATTTSDLDADADRLAGRDRLTDGDRELGDDARRDAR